MDTKNLEKKMETISPFELKNQLIDMADESLKKTARTMLNAGRGPPGTGACKAGRNARRTHGRPYQSDITYGGGSELLCGCIAYKR